jgi:hypothetical protein
MSNNHDGKPAYVCGPLTELAPNVQAEVKTFYSAIADACEEDMHVRAFVPHEHFDPEKHAHFTPLEVDKAERDQVCNKTSFLIVVAIAPSWGGGIEVEMANCNDVPAVVLHPHEKKVSRLLLGNPAVGNGAIISYHNYEQAIRKLRVEIAKMMIYA